MANLLSAGFIMAAGLIDWLLMAVAVLISIILHEIAHGYVALWNGDPTAKMQGRLTVNPIKHFDVIGFLMLMVCGFGYAKPVPVNPFNFKHQKRGIFTVAIAGVTVNLLLAFVASGFMVLMNLMAVWFPGGVGVFGGFESFFLYLMLVNLSLFFFNLLPIYPLDGFRVVEAFTKFNNPVTKFIRDYGMYILIVLVGLGVLVDLIPGMPRYFDILGLYIMNARNAVVRLFMLFWGLF